MVNVNCEHEQMVNKPPSSYDTMDVGYGSAGYDNVKPIANYNAPEPYPQSYPKPDCKPESSYSSDCTPKPYPAPAISPAYQPAVTPSYGKPSCCSPPIIINCCSIQPTTTTTPTTTPTTTAHPEKDILISKFIAIRARPSKGFGGHFLKPIKFSDLKNVGFSFLRPFKTMKDKDGGSKEHLIPVVTAEEVVNSGLKGSKSGIVAGKTIGLFAIPFINKID